LIYIYLIKLKIKKNSMNKLKLILPFSIMLIYGFYNSVSSQEKDMVPFRPETGSWYKGSSSNTTDNSQSVWQFVQTPLNTNIMDIFFIDSLKGWLSHASNGAMRTTDSGFNWTLMSFADTNFSTGYNSVYFINQNTGWFVGGALQIRKTTDGGLTWFKQYGAPQAGIAHSVYFFDANNGVVCGSKGFPYKPFVERTTNGGTTWIEQSPTLPTAQELNSQYWFNASTGWIAGYDVLLYTTNAGATFTDLYTNIPPSGNGHIDLLSIIFVTQQTGWIGAANLERNNVYKTTNGGVNWVFQQNPISQNGMNQINDVLFINSDSGWAVHGTPTSGAIMFTSNGGTNWSIEEQSVNWFECLSNYQNKKIWCGANFGKVWYTILSGIIGITPENNKIPDEFSLSQNYPNPFNPATKIKFSVPKSENVNLAIYDALGNEISVLVNESLKAGEYEIEWKGAVNSSGVYFYTMQAGGFRDSRKMILIK
jgi:photosystem II stability/assembly factor-like uncharacterized protein